MFLFFYKQMKTWNQAQICLAILDFKSQIMLSICLGYHGNVKLLCDHESVL